MDEYKVALNIARIAQLEQEIAILKTFSRWDWWAISRIPARKAHLEKMKELGLFTGE